MTPPEPPMLQTSARRGSALRRMLWTHLGSWAFFVSFHNWYGVRRALLRLFGASVAPTSRLRPSATITHPWNFSIGHESAVGDLAWIDSSAGVHIGDYCTVSQHAKVLSRLEAPARAALPAQGRIVIEDDAWVAAEAMVLPGVHIHPGAILGSRALTREHLDAWGIYGGDPLRKLKTRPAPTT